MTTNDDFDLAADTESISAIYAAIDAVGPRHGGITITIAGKFCEVKILPMVLGSVVHDDIAGPKEAKVATHGSDGVPHHLTAGWGVSEGRNFEIYVDGCEVPNVIEAHRLEGWVDELITKNQNGTIRKRIHGDVSFKETF